jgi:hypothetical protein
VSQRDDRAGLLADGRDVSPDAQVVPDAKHDRGVLTVAVHGSVSVEYHELAEAIGLTRAAARNLTADPELAARRLEELEQLLENLMARLEEHRP